MAARTPAKTPPATDPAPQATTLADVLDRALRGPWRDVKSFTTLHSNVKFVKERLGDHVIGAVTADVLENFAARMFEQGYKPATVKRKLDVIGRTLTLAVKWGLIPARPAMPEVRVRNMKDRVLEHAEETSVYAALALRRLREPWRGWDEVEDLIIILLQTGARLGEIINLRPGDLNLREKQVEFGRFMTKNDRPRTVPLTDAAVAAFRRRLTDQTEVRGCETGGCKVAPMWSLNETKAWFMWSILRKDVGGMDDVTLHTLRHTALTRLARGGMPLAHLSQWAGHSDPRITMSRYLHLMPSDLHAGVTILEGATQ